VAIIAPVLASSLLTVLSMMFAIQMSVPSTAKPEGPFPVEKVPTMVPLLASSSVTVLPFWFVTPFHIFSFEV
jgi:hypothetical protein